MNPDKEYKETRIDAKAENEIKKYRKWLRHSYDAQLFLKVIVQPRTVSKILVKKSGKI